MSADNREFTLHLHLSKARVTALNTHARGIICIFVSLVIINSRRMRDGYDSRSVCVCVCVCLSVCYRTSGYIPCLYVESRVPLGFSWRF